MDTIPTWRIPGHSVPLLVSVHDVMPSTMPAVRAIVARLLEWGVQGAGLLVVPGLQWDSEDLSQLRDWSRSGFVLAGHGWNHRCTDHRRIGHRIHSALMSRDAAEHLSRPAAELRDLVRRNYGWFRDADLPAPEMYVPPAWAMGALTNRDLDELPFRYYETLTGIYDAMARRRYRLPLAGFEADTAARAFGLRIFNRINRRWSVHGKAVLRIAIHPYDFSYRLAGDLHAILGRSAVLASEG